MPDYNRMIQRFRGIAFLGNYLPRACGIATFTHDLATTVARQVGGDQPVIVAAMNDLPEGYSYPDIVKFELRQDYQIDYSRAADFLNFSHIDIVSLQHEYGIYGGEYGSNVLTFLRDLNRPAVVTCHTVLEHPKRQQKEVLAEIAAHSQKLVVMSRRAYGFLENAYSIPRNKLAFIPHGIHDTPFIDPNYYKDKFGVEGRRVLLTFGLITPAKGIEYVIEALPQIVERHPKTTYVILGTTHPAVIREQGESYRLSLQRRVRELGLEENVLFYPLFVEIEELLEYLGATDIFVTPYLHLEQITSGALAYAMGAGKAVVSTPYWHAEELLADERGCLVPPRNSDALAREIIGLLDDEVKLSAMRKRAYTYCRGMVWSAVARNYLDLFDEVRSQAPTCFPTTSVTRSPLAHTNLPLPKIDHILRLTDDTGPSRHARHAVPDWSFGYSLDDAAATLVASTKFNAIHKSDEALKLTETCLALFQTLIGDNDHTQIADGLDYTRRKVGTASDESVGKAIWALGYMVWRGPDYLAAAANDLFHQILPPDPMGSPRAAAYAVLGCCNYLRSFQGASAVRRFLKAQIKIIESYVDSPDWPEELGCTDWPVLTQACCVTATLTDSEKQRVLSGELVAKTCEITSNGTVFLSLGANPDAEELPTTGAAFIEALGAAFYDSRDSELLHYIRSAIDWFLGVNRLDIALYNFSTGGCYDAMTSAGVNRNQGTESTVYCLLAFLSLNKIIGLDDSTY
jgi:glycosyltransferase involved in cell wall biosynthesis